MDIDLKVDGLGQVDIDIQNGDIVTTNGLYTAVYLSVFCESRDKEQGGGWFGDVFEDVYTGSRLWTLAREKRTAKVLNSAIAIVNECLEWLIDDGIAKKIEVSIVDNTIIIDIYKPDGTKEKFNLNWEQGHAL